VFVLDGTVKITLVVMSLVRYTALYEICNYSLMLLVCGAACCRCCPNNEGWVQGLFREPPHLTGDETACELLHTQSVEVCGLDKSRY
jgi:hypothetical protein